MQNHVEPPVLMSRLMMFVFATSLVVLGTLALTVKNMFPLSRPQIFFLTTDVRDNFDVQLASMPDAKQNLEVYKSAFVREYIKHRNEVVSNPKVMQLKWNNANGFVKQTSTPEVYAEFAKTDMFNAMMRDGMPGFDFMCSVSFTESPDSEKIKDTANGRAAVDAYVVRFRYACTDNKTGQTTPKTYTIKIKLVPDDKIQFKWRDRIDNPLGLRVSEYEIVGDTGDPLNTGFRETM